MRPELCYLVVKAVDFSAGGVKVLSLAAGGVFQELPRSRAQQFPPIP